MGEFTKRAGIALVFIILAALYFLDVLSGENLLVERDLHAFFIPPRLFWVEAVKHLSFPFWNPYYLAGHPLFATLQPGVLYPFSLFYLFLPFAVVFNNTIVLHFALAGIFTYLLMRAQKASHAAAFISGFCFVFGGYLISVHSLLSTLLSVVWVPLFLLVYFSAFYKNKISISIWAGLTGTVMFLGGGVEVCYLIFPIVFLLSVFPSLVFEESQYPPLKTRLTCFAVFALTFAGFSAVQLLPFAEVSRLSVRALGLPYWEATFWSMHPADLITFFIPDLYGYRTLEKYWIDQNWLKSIYLGSAPFLLSLFFFLKRERKPQTFILLILLSLVLAFGKHTLFYPFLYKYVPFFNQLRFPAKFIFLTIFLISLAAGFGYDRLKEGLDLQRTSRLTKGIFGIGFLSIVFFGILNAYEEPIVSFCKDAGWDKPEYNDIYINLANARRFLFFTGCFSLFLFLWGNATSGKKVFAYGIIFVLILDLFFSNHDFYAKIPTKTYMEPTANLKYIFSHQSSSRVFVTKKTAENNREVIVVKGQDGLDVNKDRVLGGLGLQHGIFQTSLGAEVTIQIRYKRFLDLIYTSPSPDATNLLNLTNTKYLVSIPPIKSPDYKLVHMNVPLDFDKFENEKTIKVYENLQVLPRAFLVGACYKVGSEKEYKDILSSKEFHPEQVVLLDKSEAPQGLTCEKSAFLLSESAKDAGEVVDITDYQNNSVELRVKLNSRKFLFMSESYYPGWSALVDGKPETIYRANYIFRALLLEPGEHKIVFRYNPLSFKIGAGITLLTIMVCTVVLVRKNL